MISRDCHTERWISDVFVKHANGEVHRQTGNGFSLENWGVSEDGKITCWKQKVGVLGWLSLFFLCAK